METAAEPFLLATMHRTEEFIHLAPGSRGFDIAHAATSQARRNCQTSTRKLTDLDKIADSIDNIQHKRSIHTTPQTRYVSAVPDTTGFVPSEKGRMSSSIHLHSRRASAQC